MDRIQLIRTQEEITGKLAKFQLLRNQIKRKYGTDDLIYMAEADMITIIGDNEGIHASDIAHRLGISKSAVSKTVIKLRKKSLIERDNQASDTRKLLLRLTPKGRIIYDYHKKIDENLNDHLMTALLKCTNEELEAYIKIANIYVQGLYNIVGLNGGK